MTPEQIEAMKKGFSESLSEALPDAVATAVKAENEALTRKLADVETQMAELAKQHKFAGTDSKETFEKLAKAVFVKSAIEVYQKGILEDQPSTGIFETNAKAAFQNEGIATEGLEFVFDQFEKSVLYFLKQYPLVDEVGSITIKGVTIKLPTWVNAVTAGWFGEGATITKSKGTTGFLTFSVKKLGSLVTITEEMLEDNMTTEDLFDLITRSVANSQAAIIENGILNSESTNILGILPNANTVNVVLPTGNTQLRNVTSTVLDNGLIDLDASISDEYVGNLNNAVAVMSKYTLGILKKAKTTTGDYLYPELREVNPRLLGKYRIITSTKMPVQGLAQDLLSTKHIMIGNIKDFYLLVKSRKFTATIGYATGDMEADLKSLKVTQRLTGNVLAGQAFAVLVTSAT